MTSLDEFAARWRNDATAHADVVRAFTAAMEADRKLRTHRDHIERHALGCGERAFHWLWHLVVRDWLYREQAGPFRFLEIGVFCGQVLSLVSLLARRSGIVAKVVGVSTFDGRNMIGAHHAHEPSFYRGVIESLFHTFSLPPAVLIGGDSTDPRVIRQVQAEGPFDAVYIDASHAYDDVCSDVTAYAPLVKPGGLLLGDDAGIVLDLPAGHFRGVEGCPRAFEELVPSGAVGAWTHLGNVMHLRVWRRMWHDAD